jgi:glucan phosphoethanolaminetransferase (alkaline phosphatase superfamily)
MVSQHLQSGTKGRGTMLYRLQEFLSPRACSVIMLAALFCTLTVKLFHSLRYGLLTEYPDWVMSDLSVLITVEVVLSLVCFRWPKKNVVRLATVVAAVVCTWSVMNAGWLIRTGTQILPRVLLPLFRAPANSLFIVGVNLAKMPVAAVVLLAPSAVALIFFFFVLARPKLPVFSRRWFCIRIVFSLAIVVIAVAVRPVFANRGSLQIGSAGLRYNSQLRAVVSLMLTDYRRPPNPKREIPAIDNLNIGLKQQHVKHNILLVILEGVQYQYTSLGSEHNDLTPYLATLAKQGVVFSNTRSTLTHTTKALFALLTGRFASASQDIAETVPVGSPYASIATILAGKLGYRTAFFQSAMGSFESRPGLVYNLGYEDFWARDDSDDPNCFLGYLACDEFSMLKPINEWIKSEDKPFLLTVLCSVTHDPYEIPEWFGTPAKEPLERYLQSISYTDRFLAAMDVELGNLGVADNTIFCVIGDHGEAFGEHGLLGHERIAFDEVLRIPFCLRIPFSIQTGVKIAEPASSIDLTPTLLGLVGFDVESIGFDGVDLLNAIPKDRRIFFTGWMHEGPAGFVKGNRKFIYNPTNKTTCAYDLAADPKELNRIELPQKKADEIGREIIDWRKSTIFKIDQQRNGKKELFDNWICRWTDRVSSTKRIKR